MYDCSYATVYKGQLTLIVTKEDQIQQSGSLEIWQKRNEGFENLK